MINLQHDFSNYRVQVLDFLFLLKSPASWTSKYRHHRPRAGVQASGLPESRQSRESVRVRRIRSAVALDDIHLSRSLDSCQNPSAVAPFNESVVGLAAVRRTNANSRVQIRGPHGHRSPGAWTFSTGQEPRHLDSLGSTEAQDRMRRVGLLKSSDLFGAQAQRERGYGVLKMVRLGGADNWRGDPRLAEQPCKRDLRA